MIFQRILLLAALLAGLGACTPQNNPPQTAAASAAGMQAPLPPDVERRVGAA